MFTKNYYAALATAFVRSDGASGANAVDINGNNRTLVKNCNGDDTSYKYNSVVFAATLSREVYTSYVTEKDLTATIQDPYWRYNVYFGKGKTPATVNDYKLESIITSGLSINEMSESSSFADNVVTKTAKYTLSNTSASEITIGEIGFIKYINDRYYLLERTVLDEPITIPSGGAGTVNYEIKIQVPTAPTE